MEDTECVLGEDGKGPRFCVAAARKISYTRRAVANEATTADWDSRIDPLYCYWNDTVMHVNAKPRCRRHPVLQEAPRKDAKMGKW